MNKYDLIKKIRELMVVHNLDTYVVTKFDPHISEYGPAHYNYVGFISGFTGSTATLTITQDEVCLFVDGRYHIQADSQVKDTEIKVMKLGKKDVPTMVEYVGKVSKDSDTIGFIGETVPQSIVKQMEAKCKDVNVNFIGTINILDELWENRPSLLDNNVFEHEIQFTGLSFEDKLKNVYEKMEADKTHTYIISCLDDIAWLLNLRGKGVSAATTFRSYLIIDKDIVKLFVDDTKFDNVNLSDKIKVYPYEDFYKNVENIPHTVKVALKSNSNSLIFSSIKSEDVSSLTNDYTEILKSIKSDIELKNIENAYLKDCVALVRAIKYIKENATSLNELTVDEVLYRERSKEEHYVMPSFSTIAGYKENGALMHYSATKENHSDLKNEGFLLIDSGSHFLDGTTDITRTIVLGDITDEMKRDFTLVMRSMSNLLRAKFLKGCTGVQLDMYARMPMWDVLSDYKCGTGHGIGFCLNVHEGPNGFSSKSTAVAEPNMVYTNEPGVYIEGKYGIRTENTMYVKKISENDNGVFYGFENLSYFPIDLDGIDKSLLSETEVNWLNDYHKATFEKLSPFLTEDEKAWLKKETRAI
ncbi:MAG: M24 family metallopeptidase [Lachnospirales bacterium]